MTFIASIVSGFNTLTAAEKKFILFETKLVYFLYILVAIN